MDYDNPRSAGEIDPMAKATEKFELIKTDLVFADFLRNVRMESRMDTGPDSSLWKDMDANGFRDDKPLVVAKVGDRYRVIQGHRRFKVATGIREKNPDKLDRLPCLVFSNLSEMDELRMLVDQFHTQSLNDFETYLAVKRLLTTGLSEEQIGQQIGKSRGFVQRRKQIARLPQKVEDLYRANAEGGKDAPRFKFTDGDLQKMDVAANEDRSAGRDPEADGSLFAERWTSLVTTGAAAPADPKAKTRKDSLDMALMLKEPIIEAVLNWAAGNPVNLGDVKESISTLRAKASQFNDVSIERDDLRNELSVAEALITKLRADLDTAETLLNADRSAGEADRADSDVA